MGDEIRILQVDDDPDVADLTATFLERADDRFVVETASSADEGLDRLRERQPDCIVSDYDMPETDGIEFLEAVREDHPDLPFLLFTGKGSEAVASDAISAGATDFLQKQSGSGQYDLLANRIRNAVEQYRSETELRQTAARLSALFDGSPDMINVHDADGNLLDPNPRFCEETGYDAAELTGMKVWDIDTQLEEAAATELWAGMDVGDRHRLTSEFRRKDGSTFPVEIHLRRLDLDGESRFIVISRDITGQREREATLRRYERIVNTMEESACIYDEDGRFEVVNEYLADFYETTPDALEGEMSNLIPAIRANADGDPFQELLDGARAEIRGEMESEFPDRGREVLAYRLTPLEVDGTIEGVVGVAHEVTEHKDRERELEAKNRQLEEFASVVSHDLRNPLNVAQGRLRLLTMEMDEPSEHAEAIKTSLDRMEAIVDDVLTLALHGDQLSEIGTVSLSELASGCWRNVDTSRATLDIATDRAIRADPGRLRHLFENLYRNAIEHGSTGSRPQAHGNAVERGGGRASSEHGDDAATGDADVSVRVGELADGFYVEDDGTGIPEDDRESVFEAGYSTSEDGTGLGLRIVEQIVDAHGWEVSVTESDDGGARFEITGVAFVENA